MGWANGSTVMDNIINGAMELLPDDHDKRKKLYRCIIKALEDQDWDTEDECIGEDPAFDEALRELHPTWF